MDVAICRSGITLLERKRMADEPKNKEKEGEEKGAAPQKKSKTKLIIFIAVGVVLVAGLVVGGLLFFKRGPATETKKAPSKEEVKAETKKEAAKQDENLTMFSLDPFVVNLVSNPSEIRYLKVTIKLQLAKADYTQEMTDHLPQIRDALLILLSSKDYVALRTVEGKMELRDEILERVNRIAKGDKAKAAYFTEFVIQ
jgi:flagellar FliL protein